MFTQLDFQRYNDLLGKVYACSTIQELRETALYGLQGVVPYQSAAFFLVNPHNQQFLEPHMYAMDADSFTAYRDYYESRDQYKRAVFAGPHIPPVDRSSDYMDYTVWRRNEHRSEFLLPRGMYHIACIQVFHHNQMTGELSLHRGRADADFADREMALLRALHGHLSSAFSTLARLGENWVTAIHTFKDPAQNLSLCLLDSHYQLQGATPSSLDLLPQQLITGQSLYSHLRDVCYGLSQQRRYSSHPPSWSHSGNVQLKNGLCRFQVTYVSVESSHALPGFLIIFHPDMGEEGSGQDRHLTKREAEIASLMARGKTNKEIAGDLCISENTVKTFVKRLFIKMGVHSRSELISALYKMNLGQ